MNICRLHAFEFEDLRWFPGCLRDACTSIVRFSGKHFGWTLSLAKEVTSILDETGETEVVDLCSGDGGPIIGISDALNDQGLNITITLTDLFPSATAQARLADAPPRLNYRSEPIDATDLPTDLHGHRTVFNAFHHFSPENGINLLADAVSANHPILVAEMVQRRIPDLIGSMMLPIVVMLSVPFLRPFRLTWLLFTYLLPIIPLFMWWDATVSVLREYTGDEMLAMARTADPTGLFTWSVRDIAVRGPFTGIALIGVPRRSEVERPRQSRAMKK